MVDEFRILFVDDEETFLYSTADLLRREGYSCDCIASVAGACELLNQNRYDLVIADIKMPGNVDLEFARQLADLKASVPMILVTGYPSIASAIQSVELPVLAYLIKPFDVQALLAKVQVAKRHASLERLVGGELARLQEYRQGLKQVETRLRRNPRGSHEQSVEAFVGVTLRNLVGGLTNLHHLTESSALAESVTADERWSVDVPREMRDVLEDAVATLQRTKGAFKSKELGELRKRLEGLLKN